jgi:hypothetical protein
MMTAKQRDTPMIACDLTAIPADIREAHSRNASRIWRAAEEIQELAQGYALRLPNAADLWLALATFVEYERRCCPFFHFTLTVEPNNGPLWLILTGPIGAKALLEVFLQEGRAGGLHK